MLYKRSSFIKWLKEVKDCEITPMDTGTRNGVLLVKNAMIKFYMGTNSKDRIDYEEIFIICNRLYIDGLPGDSDLERLE